MLLAGGGPGEETSWVPAGGARGSPSPGAAGSGPVLIARYPPLGSLEERGLLVWNQIQEESEETTMALEVYRLPYGIGTKCCTSSCTQYLPFWPKLEAGTGEQAPSLLTCLFQEPSGERRKGAAETKL